MSYQDYVTRLGNALLGRTEGFDDGAAQSGVSGFAAGAVFLVWLIVMIAFVFFSVFAGVRLSWCYNTAIGTSDGMKIVYAILVFFFSGFYIPYYAFFLNPLCGQKKNSSLIRIGGFRL